MKPRGAAYWIPAFASMTTLHVCTLATTAKLLLLARNRLWLRLQRLRIEADVEDVGIAGCSWRHRVHHVLRHQTERHAAGFIHRHRRPVDFGGDCPLLHAALHDGDTKRNLDRRRISSRAGNDATLD